MVERVWDWVLIGSIYASIVGIIIIIFKKILGDRINGKWNYLIWSILILKLIIPIGPKSNISLFNVIPLENTIDNGEKERLVKKESISTTEISEESINYNSKNNYSQKENYFNKNILRENIKILIVKIWFLGMILMLIWFIISYILFNKKLNDYYKKIYNNTNLQYKNNIDIYYKEQDFCKKKDINIYEILEYCKNKFSIKKNIRLIIHNEIVGPAILGVVNPTIILPKTFVNSIEKKHVEYILLHELAHYKRKDTIINNLLIILQCIHWFNPFIWYFFIEIRKDMEIATDEKVLENLEQAEYKEYGKTLINIFEKITLNERSLKYIAMASDKKNMKERITMIKKASFFKSKKGFITIIGLVCIVTLGAILLTSGENKYINNTLKVDSKEKYSEELLKYKSPYIGNNSNIINLINKLPMKEYYNSIELLTENEPFGIIINYKEVNQLQNFKEYFRKNAIVILSLIDNLENVIIKVADKVEYKFNRKDFENLLEKNLKEYSKSKEEFKGLLFRINDDIVKSKNITHIIETPKKAIFFKRGVENNIDEKKIEDLLTYFDKALNKKTDVSKSFLANDEIKNIYNNEKVLQFDYEYKQNINMNLPHGKEAMVYSKIIFILSGSYKDMVFFVEDNTNAYGIAGPVSFEISEELLNIIE